MSRREIQTALSRMPKSLRLSVTDCQLILFIEKNCALDYEQWPKEYRLISVLERLKRRRYLSLKYNPTRYGLTRFGFSLARWLAASIEHTTTQDRN